MLKSMFVESDVLVMGDMYVIYPRISSPNDTLIPLGTGMFLGYKKASANIGLLDHNQREKTTVVVMFLKFLVKDKIKLYENELFTFMPLKSF